MILYFCSINPNLLSCGAYTYHIWDYCKRYRWVVFWAFRLLCLSLWFFHSPFLECGYRSSAWNCGCGHTLSFLLHWHQRGISQALEPLHCHLNPSLFGYCCPCCSFLYFLCNSHSQARRILLDQIMGPVRCTQVDQYYLLQTCLFLPQPAFCC